MSCSFLSGQRPLLPQKCTAKYLVWVVATSKIALGRQKLSKMKNLKQWRWTALLRMVLAASQSQIGSKYFLHKTYDLFQMSFLSWSLVDFPLSWMGFERVSKLWFSSSPCKEDHKRNKYLTSLKTKIFKEANRAGLPLCGSLRRMEAWFKAFPELGWVAGGGKYRIGALETNGGIGPAWWWNGNTVSLNIFSMQNRNASFVTPFMHPMIMGEHMFICFAVANWYVNSIFVKRKQNLGHR